MQLTLCGQSALRQIRAIRYTCSSPTKIVRCDLLDPDPFPRKRWNWNLMGQLEFPAAISCDMASSGLGDMETSERMPSGMLLNVAVPRKADRVRLEGVRNTIYSTAMPRGAFIQVGHRLAVSSPELLFIELARELPLPELVMVGFECCGGFSLDPESPGCGNAKMNVPSQSRVARLMRFACSASRIRGARRALRALKFVADDAWSPMEAVIATMLMLPIEEGGYGLGPCELNRRFETPDALRAAAACSSRVPDILISGSGVGFNYDGEYHLDLNSIVAAVHGFDANPESSSAKDELRLSLSRVRRKAIDDMRRNRELAAQGLVVFPLTKEDMYRSGGLDAVVSQAASAIEARTGKRLVAQREALADSSAAQQRQELIRSLIPGG